MGITFSPDQHFWKCSKLSTGTTKVPPKFGIVLEQISKLFLCKPKWYKFINIFSLNSWRYFLNQFYQFSSLTRTLSERGEENIFCRLIFNAKSPPLFWIVQRQNPRKFLLKTYLSSVKVCYEMRTFPHEI